MPSKRQNSNLTSVQSLRCDAYNDDPLRVARVAMRMPDCERIAAAAERLAAVGHPVRATILSAIAIEPLCVCELSALLGMSSPALMHHLKILGKAEILEARREGKFAVYRPVDAQALAALRAAREDRTTVEVA